MTLIELTRAFLRIDAGEVEGLKCEHFDSLPLTAAELTNAHALELAKPDGKARALFMCCSACKRDAESRLRIVPQGHA